MFCITLLVPIATAVRSGQSPRWSRMTRYNLYWTHRFGGIVYTECRSTTVRYFRLDRVRVLYSYIMYEFDIFFAFCSKHILFSTYLGIFFVVIFFQSSSVTTSHNTVKLMNKYIYFLILIL